MDFGIYVAAKIDDVGYITPAENLGSSHAWVSGALFKRGRHQLRIQIFRNLLDFTVLKPDD